MSDTSQSSQTSAAITPTLPIGAGSERITVLEAGRAERNYWRDLWYYRELFAILAWRDVSASRGLSSGRS
jgi:hypothetical protein